MAFALTISHLVEMLKKPGCAICRRERVAAEQSVESFLWESVNDPTQRTKIQAAYGFCPEHTRLLAAAELYNTGRTPGVNLVFEQLGRVVSRELQAWQSREQTLGGLQSWLQQVGIGGKGGLPASVLQPAAGCMICEAAERAALNTLSTLFGEIGRQTADVLAAYQASDGLCLAHLRLGLSHFAREFPAAADWLTADTVQRLDQQAVLMKEYIRKNNWEYREEKITPEESEAWRKMLTFFTGYPGDLFTHQVEKY